MAFHVAYNHAISLNTFLAPLRRARVGGNFLNPLLLHSGTSSSSGRVESFGGTFARDGDFPGLENRHAVCHCSVL